MAPFSSYASLAVRRSSGLFIPTTLAIGTDQISSQCDGRSTAYQKHYAATKGTKASLRKRMTGVGRFSLLSETKENPSIFTTFIAITGPPLTASQFWNLWVNRGQPERHSRFHTRVVNQTDFEKIAVDQQTHCRDALPPAVPRLDLAHRIRNFLLKPLDVSHHLWEVEIATGGKIGSSGAISQTKSEVAKSVSSDPRSQNHVESIILLRGHHALADGVSLGVGLTDMLDEAPMLRDQIRELVRKHRKRSKSLFKHLYRLLRRFVWFLLGSVRVMMHQMYLLWITPVNPFELLLNEEERKIVGRTVSWCDAAPLEQIKTVARACGERVTVNDVMVSCVAYAIQEQLREHQRRRISEGIKNVPEIRGINVIIPVHLAGGVLPPGKSLSNLIGALCCRVPTLVKPKLQDSIVPATERLSSVHKSLVAEKGTPAAYVSYTMAHIGANYLPVSWTKSLFRRANANATVAVSNVRGPEDKLHLDGRTIESISGFFPLPPGIPVGVVAHSYAGVVSLTVTAEEWAVPDADKFMTWMLEEYQRLVEETTTKKI